MKRRSARPFTVEIKQTRAARSAAAEVDSRPRTGQDLWHDVPLLEMTEAPASPPPSPRFAAPPASPQAQAQSQAPARRILQSLVPIFDPPSEPEMPKKAVVERLPRVRRPKLPSQPKSLVEPKPAPVVVEAPRAIARPVLEAPVPAPDIAAEPASAPPRANRLSRKTAVLRPGERWKRRLPRALW